MTTSPVVIAFQEEMRFGESLQFYRNPATSRPLARVSAALASSPFLYVFFISYSFRGRWFLTLPPIYSFRAHLLSWGQGCRDACGPLPTHERCSQLTALRGSLQSVCNLSAPLPSTPRPYPSPLPISQADGTSQRVAPVLCHPLSDVF